MTGRRPFRGSDRTSDVSPLAPVTVRPAERADLLAVQRIENRCFTQPWPFDAFERFLGEEAFLVAERDDGVGGRSVDDGTDESGRVGNGIDTGAVVGFAVADVTPNFGQDIGHLKDLAVLPDHRGEGLGRLLLRSALTRLAAQGAAVVKLEVREGNDGARSLYRSEGFDPLRRVPRYYDDGEDALVMVLDLSTWSGTDSGPSGTDSDRSATDSDRTPDAGPPRE